MGKLARTRILGGRKVIGRPSLNFDSKDFRDSLSTKENAQFESSGLFEVVEKLFSGVKLHTQDLSLLFEKASLPSLFKLVSMFNSDPREQTDIPTIFLPIDNWLDILDPETVLMRAIGHIRKQPVLPEQLIIEVHDFSEMKHLWPDLIYEFKRYASDAATIIGPDPEALMKWIEATDRTNSSVVQRFQFDQKLLQLQEAGFDRLLPTTAHNLLAAVSESGFPVEACQTIVEGSDCPTTARSMIRASRSVGGDIGLSSWSLSISQGDGNGVLKQAALDSLSFRAHLIASLIYPEATHLLNGSCLSQEGACLIKEAGIKTQSWVTSDRRTVANTNCFALNDVFKREAVILTQDFRPYE